MSTPAIPGFRPVPFTGVIFVMAEAARRGYRYGHPDWCNLGQGQPETGPLPGAPPRVHQVEIDVDDQDYAPVPGIWELREAVAELYNRLYRRGQPLAVHRARTSRICGGGRASLTRAVAALGQVNLGHFLPDYTAYEELLDIFKLFTSIPDPAGGRAAAITSASTTCAARSRAAGSRALLLSNPCNPTGKVIAGRGAGALGRARARARLHAADRRVLLALRLGATGRSGPASCSGRATSRTWTRIRSCSSTGSPRTGATRAGASPGSWARRQVIEAVSSAARFLDGGGSKPLQRAAIPLLGPEVVTAETAAIREAFLRKRDDHDRGAARGGRALRRRARGHVLLLGRRRRAAARRSTTGCRSSARRWSRRSSPCRASSST